MHRWLLGGAAMFFAGLQPTSAFGLEPTATDARKIAEAMEGRDEGDRVRMEVTLVVIDASGRRRERTMRQLRKDFAGGRKTLLFFESPADVRDTGLPNAWLSGGRKLKYVKPDRIERVDGIWLARRATVRVVRGSQVESQTLLTITRVHVGQTDVTDDLLTERRLEQGL